MISKIPSPDDDGATRRRNNKQEHGVVNERLSNVAVHRETDVNVLRYVHYEFCKRSGEGSLGSVGTRTTTKSAEC